MITEEQKRLTGMARQELIDYIEDVRARMDAASERARVKAEAVSGVQLVEGADVREEKPHPCYSPESDPLPGDLIERIESDPVLAAIRRRKEERRRDRERANRAARPTETVVNQGGGSNDE
jgi:hypothetical protein